MLFCTNARKLVLCSDASAPLYISAFEYPVSFEVYPKGSTIQKNKDGTITIIPLENV